MPQIHDFKVQKLFLIAIIFKVGSSFLGWVFDRPWTLGLVLPLAIMGLYIALGLTRRDRDVSDEKFADTCYYIGFIFTITSIIFSLLDLPNIGTKIQDIAVRFGAAMVSTVAGLVVRVYLVSFKKDVADAIKDAEAAVLEASQKFREQLVMAYEKLRDFQIEVDKAALSTVERVSMHVEKLSQDHATKLADFFTDLTARNQKAFTTALDEVKSASLRLSDSVDGYSHGMRSNLGSIESKVTAFTEAVTERLRKTTFPDDYFAKHLAAPLDLLKDAAKDVSHQVSLASEGVTESTTVLSATLKKLKTKAAATEESLEAVIRLTGQQHAVLDAAQGQLSTLKKLGETLSAFDGLLTTTVSGLTASTASTSALTARVDAVVSESVASRQQLDVSLADVVSQLSLSAAATQAMGAHLERAASSSQVLATKIDASAAASERIVAQLGVNVAATTQVVGKLEGVAATDLEAARSLVSIGVKADSAITKVDAAVEQLQSMVRQLGGLDAALRLQGAELKQVAERIRDIRVDASPAANAPIAVPMTSGHPSATGLTRPAATPHAQSSIAPATQTPTGIGQRLPGENHIGATGAAVNNGNGTPPRLSGGRPLPAPVGHTHTPLQAPQGLITGGSMPVATPSITPTSPVHSTLPAVRSTEAPRPFGAANPPSTDT